MRREFTTRHGLLVVSFRGDGYAAFTAQLSPDKSARVTFETSHPSVTQPVTEMMSADGPRTRELAAVLSDRLFSLYDDECPDEVVERLEQLGASA